MPAWPPPQCRFDQVAVQRLFRVIGGSTPKSNNELNWGGHLSWATPVDLRPVDGGVIAKTDRTLTAKGLEDAGLTVLPVGSIIISCRAPIGYVAVNSEPMATNQGCKGLIPVRPLDSRYFRYQLEAARPVLNALGRGATFPELSSHDIAELEVAVPPEEIQRGIGDFLDVETGRIDALVRKNRACQSLVETRRREAVSRAITLGLDSSETRETALGWAPEIASHFSVGSYSLYARTGSGHTPSRSNPEYWEDADIPWVTTGDVAQLRTGRVERLEATKHQISELGLVNSAATLHPESTVFLSRTASVGFAGIMGSDMATSQDFFTWTCDPRLSPEYLLWSLRAMGWRGEFERLSYGSTHKTIYVPDLMTLRGPIPPRGEQDRIVRHIRELIAPVHDLIDTIDHEIDLLEERHYAVITAAVTGRLHLDEYGEAA